MVSRERKSRIGEGDSPRFNAHRLTTTVVLAGMRWQSHAIASVVSWGSERRTGAK